MYEYFVIKGKSRSGRKPQMNGNEKKVKDIKRKQDPLQRAHIARARFSRIRFGSFGFRCGQ